MLPPCEYDVLIDRLVLSSALHALDGGDGSLFTVNRIQVQYLTMTSNHSLPAGVWGGHWFGLVHKVRWPLFTPEHSIKGGKPCWTLRVSISVQGGAMQPRVMPCWGVWGCHLGAGTTPRGASTTPWAVEFWRVDRRTLGMESVSVGGGGHRSTAS